MKSGSLSRILKDCMRSAPRLLICYQKMAVVSRHFQALWKHSDRQALQDKQSLNVVKTKKVITRLVGMRGDIPKEAQQMSIRMIQLNSREEWLEHRKKYLGGSDASAIIGLNPWKSNVDLWLEKTEQIICEDISDKPNVQYGIAAEPVIRELFKISYPQYKMHYIENNSWLNDRIPFAAASLDGWLVEKETGRKGIWESKTSEIVSSMHKEKWAGRIPDNYYAQLLHYLMVCEDCEFAHLTALLTFKFDDKEIYQQVKNYHIERSEVEEDIEFLKSSESNFWWAVQNKSRPALLLPNF